MSFYQAKSDTRQDGAETLFWCLVQGRYAEASLLVPALENTAAPDVLFNVALVYRRMEDERRAASFLERALAAARRLPPESAPPAPAAYARLRAAGLERAAGAPMRAEYVRAFPAQAGENILLALIACYTSLDMPDKANALAAGLSGPAFADYKTTR